MLPAPLSFLCLFLSQYCIFTCKVELPTILSGVFIHLQMAMAMDNRWRKVRPVMRYCPLKAVHGEIPVKIRSLFFKTLYVKLVNGVLGVYPADDLFCDYPLTIAWMYEASELSQDLEQRKIYIRPKGAIFRVVLSFKRDIKMFNLWVATLKQARTRIGDYYEISEKLLGKGKYAKLYEGYDKRTGEKVAIKVINKKDRSEAFLKRMYSEMEHVRVVKHPLTMKTFDIFEEPLNCYMVMEYVAQENLANVLPAGRKRFYEYLAIDFSP